MSLSSLKALLTEIQQRLHLELGCNTMPRIEQILEQVHGKTLFITLDIRYGYNNICIRPEDRWKLAFTGPDGAYEPAVMFFRMFNVPATFQRAMDRIFTKLKHCYPGCIFMYMDDILIATNDNEELHKQIVHKVLKLLEEEDFHLKLNKCLFH